MNSSPKYMPGSQRKWVFILCLCLIGCFTLMGTGFAAKGSGSIAEDEEIVVSPAVTGQTLTRSPAGSALDTPALAVSLEVNAASAVLMDAVTGRILLEKEPHVALPPASVTKLMTLLVAAEAVEKGRVSLEDMVTTSPEASSMGGSQVYLEVGEQMSLKDMLLAVAVGSGNDASVAVAEHIGGSEGDFVDEMNKRAAELEMKNTHFENSHGLSSESHYTSAYDLAVLGRESLRHPLLLELTSTKEHKLRNGAFQLYNTNRMLWWYQGTDGFKTGSTEEAKRCLASTVQREGMRLICVVMGAPESQGHFRESMKIYNYGFAKYIYKPFVPADESLGQAAISKGAQETVALVPEKEVGACFEKGQEEDYRYESTFERNVGAPVVKGQVLGQVTLYCNDEEISRTNLVASQEVPKLTLPGMIQRTLDKVYSLDK
ncbi:MAG: D-alanyl-D-alanine carboxypeptidase [Peptococcaceae bacterium]|nr:D-alanyl-D-alanine carboxypeptidase [Peptococcaceae bacterium]